VFGVGLALGLWLYSGYEQCSSVAEEIENPQRSYPRALAIVVPLSVATYFLPALFSLAALGNWRDWNTAYLSTAARLLGGGWLGFLMTLAAMLGNISLLNATVLTSTRMPSSMSEDGYLPAIFAAKHPKFGTPWLRILVTVLTVLSAWRLRRLQPELKRPFQIPGRATGLAFVVIAPIAMSGVALVGSDRFALKWGPLPVGLGVVLYFVFAKIKKFLDSYTT